MINTEKAIKYIKNRKKALTIIIGNQKGGVGKTTNSYLLAYNLAKKGLKTLVADLDPQANATKTLMLTRSRDTDEVNTISTTLMLGIENKDLTPLPVEIKNNLWLLPSYIDFEDFTKYLYKNTSTEYEETHLLSPLFEPLKNDFDIIILDVPPLSIEVTRNATIFADYVLISLQTHDDSLTGAEEYVNTLIRMKEKYDLPIELLGVLFMLHDSRGSVDKFIMESAEKEFGKDIIFNNIVPNMQRIKRFPINGITENDRFDEKVMDLYSTVTDEFLNRIYEFK